MTPGPNTSSLFDDHNLSQYNNKRWLGIGARHGDFRVLCLICTIAPGVFGTGRKIPAIQRIF
jgi:hypothetical protein